MSDTVETAGAPKPPDNGEKPTSWSRRVVKAGQQLNRRIEGALEKIGERIDRIGYVTMSDEYSRYIGGEKYMKRKDFKFFEGLLDDFLSEGKQPSEVNQEANFFNAVADLKGYGEGLKFMDRIGFGLLSGLFLHHKKIRPIFMQVHAQKMEKALPDFITKLSEADNSNITNLDDYFKRTSNLMCDEMITAASNQFGDKDRINLGTLMVYEELGLNASFLEDPDAFAKQQFAVNGIGTFFEIFKIVLDDAIRNGKDVNEAVRHGFMDRDGVAFQLMRTHIVDFENPDLVSVREAGDVDRMKSLLEKKDFIGGMCPAILKTGAGERPIAYEYAATILKNIPHRLLVKATSSASPQA